MKTEKSGREMSKMLADPQHRIGQVIRPHDQLRGRLGLVGDLRQDIARAHDVLLFFRRTIIGEKHFRVHRPKKVFRFLDVLTGGKSLEKRNEGVARLAQFPFLAQFGRGLKLRQAHIRHRLDRNFAALFLLDLALRLDEQGRN